MVDELASPQMGCLRVIEVFSLDVFTLMSARKSGRDLTYVDVATDALRRDIGEGVIVPYASIARLLELKSGTGRSKDLSDVAILEEIARGERERTSVDLATMEPGSTGDGGHSDQGEWPLPNGG